MKESVPKESVFSLGFSETELACYLQTLYTEICKGLWVGFLKKLIAFTFYLYYLLAGIYFAILIQTRMTHRKDCFFSPSSVFP